MDLDDLDRTGIEKEEEERRGLLYLTAHQRFRVQLNRSYPPVGLSGNEADDDTGKLSLIVAIISFRDFSKKKHDI